MTKYAQEILFNGSVAVSNTYNANNITITGPHVGLYNLGSNPEDKFLGPKLTQVIRHFDTTAFAIGAMHVEEYGDKHYIFVGTAAAAAATRTIMMYTYDKKTETVSTGTLVTMTYPNAGPHILKSMRVIFKHYTTGDVAVSGTAVTGTGTAWRTSNLHVGSRIGFGSTDPLQITTWYEISAIGSDTGITLTGSAGTIAGGTPYVIEDMRIVMLTTSTAAELGGVFVACGLRIELFNSGAVIPAATTVDGIRAVYKLKDRNLVTHTAGAGLILGNYTDWQNETIYGIDGLATTLKLYRYNIRANMSALGITAGNVTLTGANTANTTGVAVTGTIVSFNNGRSANTRSGPGANIDSLYMSTASRIYRVAKTSVTDGSSGFIADSMTENPQGGTGSVTATAGFLGVEYAGTLDKFLIPAYAAPTGRMYVTSYRSDGGQFDSHLMVTSTLSDGAAGNNPVFPKIATTGAYVWVEAGILYVFGTAATAIAGNIYIYPAFGAHWHIAAQSGSRVILPKMTFSSVPTRLSRIYTNEIEYISTLTELSKTTDPYRMYYRTAGIDDDSGTFLAVPQSGDLTGLTPTSEIQFAIEFRTWSDLCMPARLTSLSLVYEADDALPDEYQWNLGDSNTVDGTFGFTQKQLFTEWPLTHTINIYRVDNDTIALTQDSTGNTFGVFEYANSSNVWVAGTANNTVGTRRRFRPTGSLPGGVDLYATINVTTP